MDYIPCFSLFYENALILQYKHSCFLLIFWQNIKLPYKLTTFPHVAFSYIALLLLFVILSVTFYKFL